MTAGFGGPNCGDRPHVVYFCFDADDWALYIGATCDLTRRLGHHRSTGWYRDHFAYLATSEPMPLADARAAERCAISEYGPAFNIIDNTARMIIHEDEADDRWIEQMAGSYTSTLHRWLDAARSAFNPCPPSARVIAALETEIAWRKNPYADLIQQVAS